MPKKTRWWMLALGVVSFTLVACGGGGGAATTTATAAPEEKRASAADVATGLNKIDRIVKDAAAALPGDKAKAKELSEQIEPVWEDVEGTVKANDSNAYISFEDAFAALERAATDGDSAKARKAADDVSRTVQAYLTKYPG